MFITIEISRLIQWLPGWWRCKGITSFRVWWLFFSVSIHPMRYDEMIELAGSGSVEWGGTRTPNPADELKALQKIVLSPEIQKRVDAARKETTRR